MKLPLTITLLFLTLLGYSQNFSKLKGKTFVQFNELIELRNCIKIEARVSECSSICYELQDSISLKTIIIASREAADGRSKIITGIVVIGAKAINRDKFIQIGSYDTKIPIMGVETHAFVIAMEQKQTDYKLDSTGVYPAKLSKSIRIFKAWTFDCANNELRKMSIKGLYRINEGYYRD